MRTSHIIHREIDLSCIEGVAVELRHILPKGWTTTKESDSFVVRGKGRRVGRNPKTGVEVAIEPRQVMVFKPSNVLKARINGGTVNGHDEDDD